ncbi:MAG: MurR/RpiR family transcriptional regulator [Hespellia sp.]|nr:MurR/RpiR family transcriptional regulator [Hespellia sp.]
MKEQNVWDTMSEVYPSLTKSGRKVADYIFANKTEAQYMSITSLAEECRVADATISRFCKTLGYDGYNEFKLALAKAGATRISDLDPDAYDKITLEDGILDMAKKLYARDVTAIQQSLELLNPDDIANAVAYLHRASKVFCFGQGGSGVIAKDAWARFITATPQFQCIEDSHMQVMAASTCNPTDVILFFSYSGATKDVVDILRPAKARGAKVILITHFPKSPAAAYADILLLCGSRESPLQSGSVAAKMGQLFIIDILFNEFCRKNWEFTNTNRGLTSEALATKLL